MSLDERLREIFTRYYIEEKGRRALGDLITTEEKLVTQLKKAFADEGYRSQKEHEMDVRRKLETLKGKSMTIQEWLDRFKKQVDEFNYTNRGGREIYWTEYFEAAAKRASGIEDKGE